MRRVILSALAAAGFAGSARADLVVTIEAAGQQFSTVSDTSVETFDAAAQGNYPSYFSASLNGTYTSSAPGMVVLAPNQYGGALQSQYMSVGVQSSPTTSATLQLAAPAQYFGFYWSAGDPGNNLDFYYGNTLLTTFDSSSVVNWLNANPGSAAAYYGNPNTGENGGEAYAFINFFGTNGTAFDRIVFRNDGTGSGFENDNHTVRLDAVTPTGTPIETLTAPAVPAPAALPLAAIGFAALALRRRRA